MMYFFYSVLWKLLFWRFHITDYQNNLFLTTNSNTNLVLECRTGLCGRETVLRLTHNSCSFNWKMKMQLSKQGLDPQNFSRWPAVLVKLLNFASVLDLATRGCFLDQQEIVWSQGDKVSRFWSRHLGQKHNPHHNRWIEGLAGAMVLAEEDDHGIDSRLFRYLRILSSLNHLQCSSCVRERYWQTLLMGLGEDDAACCVWESNC